MFAFPNLHKTFFDFGLDELFVIKNLFEVSLGIIVKLNRRRIYHDYKILETDTKLVLLFEKVIKKFDFVLLWSFEYFNCVILELPMPLMNYFSQMCPSWSGENYLKRRSPQKPFLWKNNWKFSTFNVFLSSRDARSL